MDYGLLSPYVVFVVCRCLSHLDGFLVLLQVFSTIAAAFHFRLIALQDSAQRRVSLRRFCFLSSACFLIGLGLSCTTFQTSPFPWTRRTAAIDAQTGFTVRLLALPASCRFLFTLGRVALHDPIVQTFFALAHVRYCIPLATADADMMSLAPCPKFTLVFCAILGVCVWHGYSIGIGTGWVTTCQTTL